MKALKKWVFVIVTFMVGLLLASYIFNRNQVNESLRLLTMSFQGYDFFDEENLVYQTDFDNREIKFYQVGNKLYQTVNDVLPVEGITMMDSIDDKTRFIYLPEDQLLYSNNELVEKTDFFFTSMGNYNTYILDSSKEYYLEYSKTNTCYVGYQNKSLSKYSCSKSSIENNIVDWRVTEEREFSSDELEIVYVYDLYSQYVWDKDSFIADYIKLEIDQDFVKVNYYQDQVLTYQFYEISEKQLGTLLKNFS